jgi:hypothetical protein
VKSYLKDYVDYVQGVKDKASRTVASPPPSSVSSVSFVGDSQGVHYSSPQGYVSFVGTEQEFNVKSDVPNETLSGRTTPQIITDKTDKTIDTATLPMQVVGYVKGRAYGFCLECGKDRYLDSGCSYCAAKRGH